MIFFFWKSKPNTGWHYRILLGQPQQMETAELDGLKNSQLAVIEGSRIMLLGNNMTAKKYILNFSGSTYSYFFFLVNCFLQLSIYLFAYLQCMYNKNISQENRLVLVCKQKKDCSSCIHLFPFRCPVHFSLLPPGGSPWLPSDNRKWQLRSASGSAHWLREACTS